MKKIINNKVYDTDTARRLGADGECRREFTDWSETLYQKRTGEYFLHGVGGPASKYAVSMGLNQWSGGQKIIPLNVDAARDWAEKHLSADEYDEIFGLPDENAEPAALYIQLPASLMAQIRANAAKEGKTLTAYIEQTLTRALALGQ